MKPSDFEVRKINSKIGRKFIKHFHYTGSCHGGPMCWGLVYDEKLYGVIAFATPISENVRKSIWCDGYSEEMKNHTTELHRLVTLDECPHNTESWFISRGLKALKQYKPKYKAVISFADMTEGHSGTIYQASNAIYYGTTGNKSVFYRDESGNLRAPRQNGVNITKEMAKEKGWESETREAKHRYLFLLPDKYESKADIRGRLDIEEKEYP